MTIVKRHVIEHNGWLKEWDKRPKRLVASLDSPEVLFFHPSFRKKPRLIISSDMSVSNSNVE